MFIDGGFWLPEHLQNAIWNFYQPTVAITVM